MTSYRLVNPYIKGSIDTSAKAKKPIFAAKKLYSRIAELFANNVPSFFFTIQDTKTGKLYEYETNERKSGRDISYTIRTVGMTPKGRKKLRALIKDKDAQTGAAPTTTSEATTSSSRKASDPVLMVSPIELWVYMASEYQILESVVVSQVYFPVLLVTDIYPVLIV